MTVKPFAAGGTSADRRPRFMCSRCADSNPNSAGASMTIRAPRELTSDTVPAVMCWDSPRTGAPSTKAWFTTPAAFSTVANTRRESSRRSSAPPIRNSRHAAVAIQRGTDLPPQRHSMERADALATMGSSCPSRHPAATAASAESTLSISANSRRASAFARSSAFSSFICGAEMLPSR